MADQLNDPVLDPIYKAIADIEAAEELQKEAVASLQSAVMELQSRIGEDSTLRENVIWHLYWKVERVQKAWIKKAFSLKDSQVNEIISKTTMKVVCPKCRQPRQVQVSSKSEMGRYNADYYTTCEECKEAERRKQEESSKAYWEQANAHLEELRTMPYYDYLQTPEWQARRKKAMKRAGFSCQVCNAHGIRLNVHHRTYERRGNEDDRDLIVLCEDCHAIFHENGSLAEVG